MGRVRSEHGLETISNPEIISLFLLTTSRFPCSLENIHFFNFLTGALRRNQVKGKLSPDGLKHTSCRPSTHVGRLVIYAGVGSSFRVVGRQYFLVAFRSRIRFPYYLASPT